MTEEMENMENQEKRELLDVTISDIELEQLKQEAGEFKDKYFRLLAEQENTRKRLVKEKHESAQFATQGVILELLNPLDHLETALSYTDQLSDETKQWCIGFQMILSQFKDALKNQGIKEFHAEGQPFNPELHEAIELVEDDTIPAGTVVKELRKGYVIGNRTLRPARVKVSKKRSETAEDIKFLEENN